MAERGWDYEPSGAHDSADAPSTPDEMPIYLDYNATTPHDPEVIARILLGIRAWIEWRGMGSRAFEMLAL